jgi:thiamine pyrophosphokinase
MALGLEGLRKGVVWMPRCLVFGAGARFAVNERPKPGDFVAAADGGFSFLHELGMKPDLVLGDFDSSDRPEEGGYEILALPREQDATDMEAAVKEGFSRGVRVFHLFGGTGGRLDHTLANIQTLVWLARREAQGFLHDDGRVLTAVADGEIRLEPRANGYVSVFAYSGKAKGVFLEGLKYPLRDAELSDDTPLGVSNEFMGKPSRISVREGVLIVALEV